MPPMSLYRTLSVFAAFLLIGGLSFAIESIRDKDSIMLAQQADEHSQDSVNALNISELRSAVDSLSKEVSYLRSEYSKVKSELSILKLGNGNRSTTSSDMKESLNNNVENVVNNLNASENLLDDVLQNQKNYLFEAFSAEPQDLAWNSKVDRELKEKTISVGANGVKSLSTDCRSSMCRIEVVSGTSDEFDYFIKNFSEKMSWAGPMQITTTLEDSGEIIAEIFVARDGHMLPMP